MLSFLTPAKYRIHAPPFLARTTPSRYPPHTAYGLTHCMPHFLFIQLSNRPGYIETFTRCSTLILLTSCWTVEQHGLSFPVLDILHLMYWKPSKNLLVGWQLFKISRIITNIWSYLKSEPLLLNHVLEHVLHGIHEFNIPLSSIRIMRKVNTRNTVVICLKQ